MLNAKANKIIGVVALAILLVVLVLVPKFVTNQYTLHILIASGLAVILSSSFNLVTGFTGQPVFGMAAFYAVGAYTSAILATKLHLSFWLTMPLAGVAAAITGFVLGLPSLRLRKFFLAITTIAFGEVIRLIILNWVDLTRGPMGITGIPIPTPISIPLLGTMVFNNKRSFYYLTLVLVVAVVLSIRSIMNSPVGRAFLATRDDEDAAQTCGIDTRFYKLLSFVLAAFYAGIAGAMYAHYFKYISPGSFGFTESAMAVTTALVGGLGTIAGPIVGGLLLTAAPEFLRALADYRLIIYGGALLITLTFWPSGLVGGFNSLWYRLSGGSKKNNVKQGAAAKGVRE
jgi:branched-chain amino acid transport system permease protein